MASNSDSDARTFRLAWIVLGVHGVALVAMAALKAFNSDEFEHVHIAWNMKQGLLVYRDFFDNHGPFFALFNELVWRVFALPDDVGTLAVFRFLALIWASLMVVLTGAIAAQTGGRKQGLVAAALLSTSLIFLEKAAEIRPDGPQVVFWLTSVFFGVRTLHSERSLHALLAGLFLGLAVAANTKMLAGIAGFGAFGLLLIVLARDRIGWVLRMGATMGVGVVAGLLPFALYFAARDALPALVHYTLTVNFAAVRLVEATSFGPQLAVFLPTHVFLVATSLACAWALLRRREAGAEGLAGACILVLAAVTSALAPNGYYNQYYLIFVPLLAVLGSRFVVESLAPGTWTARAFAGLFVLQLLLVTVSALSLMFDGRQRMQLDEMKLVMDHTPVDEPVGFTGLDGGGYVFRPDLQFYWTNSDNLQRVMSHIEGHPIFGPRFVERLEEAAPTFIISLDSGWERAAFPNEADAAALADLGVSVKSWPEATQRYVAEHYEELDKLHLLVRREAMTPELRRAATVLAERLPTGAEALGQTE